MTVRLLRLISLLCHRHCHPATQTCVCPHTRTHAQTHTSKHTSKHTHGPHILCMVTACSLLFGCQYCNTALWLNSWPVSVCLQSVCQPCYDVICSSERQTEKLMTLVKSGKIFPAASPLSLSFCLNHHFLPSPTHTISFTYLQLTP